MKKAAFILLNIFLFIAVQSNAYEAASPQKETIIMSLKSTDNIAFGNQRVDKFKELDKTILTATYQLRFILDTIKRDTLVDQMVLQIGKNFTKFYSQRTLLDDQSYTDYETGKTSRNQGYGIDGDIYIDYDMIFNSAGKTITTIHRMPFEDEYTRSYDEAIPSFQWTYLDSKDSICGYPCLAAQTSYAGRVWKVWYTTDIPLSNGPWKLSGLPGLILKAVDNTGEYEFVCEGLSSTISPILSYKWRTKRTTKEEWRRFERRVYASPLDVLSAGGEKRFMVYDPETKKMGAFPPDWKIPYNPIERD